MTIEMLNVPLVFLEASEILKTISSWRRQAKRSYLVFTNPHSIVMCRRDSAMMLATRGADIILPDGVGIMIGARLLGIKPTGHRAPGPEFMLQLLDIGRTQRLRHFLYGAKPHVVLRLKSELTEKFPGLIICGEYSPSFHNISSEEDRKITQLISQTKPDVVWVGLGAPKQEKWMAAHVGRIDATVLIGVGAAFDFHAGEVLWAPAWVRSAGMEWLFRLVCEPARLWRRDLDGLQFLALVVRQRLGWLM